MNEVTVGTKEKNSRKLERIKLTGHHSKLKVKSQQSKPRSLVLSRSPFYPLYASTNRPAFPRSSKSHFSHICFESDVQNPDA